MSVARVGFATSHPFIIHRIFTCFSRWGNFGLSPSRIYLCSLCSYFCVLHYSCSIAKVTSLTPRWSRAQIAISQIRETARISISISKKKPNVAQMSYLPLSLSIYLSLLHTRASRASLSNVVGWQFQCHFQIYAMTANGKCPQCPRHITKVAFVTKIVSRKKQKAERMYGRE